MTLKSFYKIQNQMVSLYQHGKSRSEIVAEYDLTPSALDRWITQASQSSSFKTKIIAVHKNKS
ncbi:helix-turn-helix domain-containing protein [Gilliamella intestini]|uniref:Transposase n=1 Tax=Gilliamella intestini TaxID=1798183 RepID=A0A1C4CG44_9GAMM|nr:helix-turn-helix domain-containing protein [Gilliamella intestini]SCC18080.1 Transposase [Gilliamella intestini]